MNLYACTDLRIRMELVDMTYPLLKLKTPQDSDCLRARVCVCVWQKDQITICLLICFGGKSEVCVCVCVVVYWKKLSVMDRSLVNSSYHWKENGNQIIDCSSYSVSPVLDGDNVLYFGRRRHTKWGYKNWEYVSFSCETSIETHESKAMDRAHFWQQQQQQQ